MNLAPRPLLRPWRSLARVAWLTAVLLASVAGASAQTLCSDGVEMGQALEPATLGALSCLGYADGTTRYPHGVLGDTLEPTRLSGLWQEGGVAIALTLTLDQAHVFEDLAPRLADLDGDGVTEIITIRSHRDRGAQLAIYAPDPSARGFTLIAATPYIGRRNRWLAPVGIADFNGDGLIDIAYVDRPHLARVLRVWTFDAGTLREIAAAGGLTNHRIGEDFVTGGMRDCGAGPEMVLADADWAHVLVARVEDTEITARALAPFSPQAVTAALQCRM